jgi:hypothetical protein
VNSLTETFSRRSKLKDEQLNNLRKILTIPKKLNDQNFSKHKELKIGLLKVFKNSLILVKDLYDISENQTPNKKKEYKDFVRSIIVIIFKFLKNL